MNDLSLTPATQAVLDALTELGQGDIHELAEKAGKARSTTDKAVKTLIDAGLIIAVDADTDQAEGTPTRWTLTTAAGDTAPPDTEPADAHTTGADTTIDQDGVTGERTDQPAEEPGESTDHIESNPDDTSSDRDGTGTGAPPADHDDNANGPDVPDDNAHTSGDDAEPNSDTDMQAEAQPAAAVPAARPGDRKVMAIKAVLADHGDIGATLDVIVTESGIGHPTAARLLTAMEQADAARRLPGLPQRWIPGPTKASEVDPNPQPPRCPLCSQVIRGLATAPTATTAVQPLIHPDGTLHIVAPDGETHIVVLPTRTALRTASTTTRVGDATVNADGNQPFSRGELERLTLDYLAAHPGRQMTPQDITTALAAHLNRAVSNGAVRNNLTKAAAAGRILLVADNPLTFVHPAPADTSTDAGAPDQS
ncbi:MarR family winged helix-turn-helix transcriptional regulator [Micromonospora antibiotica]|uniref:Winged helix-turn-helix transcriptional regulator n=1 Tax=Micromonospora antibiotica TaxID=2807623 RepID=A0ABS3V728_9ACTN|nr:MarR family winged helix-turn-helix transcriptional regulator [Micromonospora antibiotica]MBO4161386.1 winged helix-turn-helix transcriptional regulator [Micromonospora antibiotica]